MRENPENFTAAFEVLESARNHLHRIEAIKVWAGLTPRQRTIALVITALEHLEERPAKSLDVSRWIGWPQPDVEKVFEGLEESPFHWAEAPGLGWCFLPSEKLEYGAES